MTLLEMLLALGLITVLTGSLLGFLFDLLGTRRRCLDVAERQRATLLVIDRLERDLMSCVAGDGRHGSGIIGEEDSIEVLSRGVPLVATGSFGDLQRSRFRFVEGGGRLEVGRAEAGAGLPLTTLAEGIGKVRFRYHDGSGWRERFDTRSDGRLPAAVEIAVWYDAWPGDIAVDDEEDSERLTFDTGSGFDDAAFAASSDLRFLDEPDPDRVRVIIIPDAAPPGDEEEES